MSRNQQFQLALTLAFASFHPGMLTKAEPPREWLYGPDQEIPGVEGEVYAAVAWDPDGDGPEPEWLVIGGDFLVAGGVVANGIAAWDGTTWREFDGGVHGPYFDAAVHALTIYEGQLVVGGKFTDAGLSACNNISRWDGSNWQPLGSGVSGMVRALTPYDGALVAGGDFITAGDQTCNRIASWNGTSWSAFPGSPPGLPSSVKALLVHDEDLVVGGSFGIRRWDGIAWNNIGTGLSNRIHALTVHNGDIVAGGTALRAGGFYNVARWNGDVWQPLGPRLGTGNYDDATVYALAVYDGELFAVGGFRTVGNLECNRLVRWGGLAWEPMGSGLQGGYHLATVYTLAHFDGEMVVGGGFTSANGVPCRSLAAWDGSSWHRFGRGFNNGIGEFVQYRGELIAAGGFTTAGHGPADRIARWDGRTWEPLGLGITGNDVDVGAAALAVHRSELFVGGRFSVAGGVACSNVARWDGSTWRPAGAGLNDRVSAFATYNGELIAGGHFYFDEQVSSSVARWDGRSWRPMENRINNFVDDLTLFEGELIACGQFCDTDCAAPSRIAKWTGSSWERLGAGVNTSVTVVEPYDRKLIAGGLFTRADGQPCNYIAAWDGTSWQPLGLGMNNWVAALTVYEGRLVAAGGFTMAGDASANGIAAWDGSTWRALGSGMGGSVGNWGPFVHALAGYRGELFAGGAFATAGDKVSAFWARWGAPPRTRQDPTASTADDRWIMPAGR